MNSKTFDVITVGDVFVDIVMSGFARWPQPGEEVLAEQLQRELGGGACITACGLARLGCSVSLLASVGANDSDWFREKLISYNVDISHLRFHPTEPTALTVAVSTNKDRSFFTYPGANQLLPELFRQAEIRNELTAARHVHIASAIEPSLLIAVVKELHGAATTVSIDVGGMEDWLSNPQSLTALREVDLFLPNEREAEFITGQTQAEAMLHAFADAGLRNVALKLGAAGSALWLAGNTYVAEPHKVDVVDTTGAGDCFDAGFIAAWLNGQAPEECLRMANRCGALSTRALGGIAAFPGAAEL